MTRIINIGAIHARHPALTLGVDVSSYQKPIDWQAAAAAGVSFVWVKAGHGRHHADRRYAEHSRALDRADILRGSFHVAILSFRGQPTDPVATAEAFLHQTSMSGPGELGAALALEPRLVKVAVRAHGHQFTREWIAAWVDRVGGKVTLRLSRWGARLLGEPIALPCWWVDCVSPVGDEPRRDGWPGWDYRQFSRHGVVPGSKVAVGLDIRR